jgi:hypothetical protein
MVVLVAFTAMPLEQATGTETTCGKLKQRDGQCALERVLLPVPVPVPVLPPLLPLVLPLALTLTLIQGV